MTIADVIERRRTSWQELEELRQKLDGPRRPRSAKVVSRFAALYRSACADLALAEAYQLPPETTAYLHRLVARCHVQLYRSRGLQLDHWIRLLLVNAPRQIYSDICVKICAILFFGLFTLSMVLGRSEASFPSYVETIVGTEAIKQMEEMYEQPLRANAAHYVTAANFYIMHNTGIGLGCFAKGILILPCIYELCFNAVTLGAIFGYMSRDSVEQGENFLQFVTAHGPFELTAIVLSASAGLRLGVSWIQTARYRRLDSLRAGAVRAVPVIGAAATLFFLAALTEGFLSPSPALYIIKALWSIMASGLLMIYFVVLGFHDGEPDAV